MLDKIKVYRRSDASEVYKYSIEKNNDAIYLNELYFDGAEKEEYILTKSDPLNKFKKENEGWWLCENYIVICSNCDTLSFQYYNYADVIGWDKNRHTTQTDKDISCSEFCGDIEISKYINRHDMEIPTFEIDIRGKYDMLSLDRLKDRIKEIETANKDFSMEKYYNPQYTSLFNFLKDNFKNDIIHTDHFDISYSALGEEKYLQLLELICY